MKHSRRSRRSRSSAETSSPPIPAPRLHEQWKGGTERNPSDVVADYMARAPKSLRESARPLDRAERIFWRHLSNTDDLGVEVFRHVPVYLPERELCRLMTFFVPRHALCLELTDVDFNTKFDGDISDETYKSVTYGMVDDERLMDHAGIVTMRFPRAMVKKNVSGSVAALRAELGLADDPGSFSIDVPR
ncbi:MAG: hypothetical protein ACYTGZ_18890 [Planctomycetota bacterium]|jgi:hypothetical protein